VPILIKKCEAIDDDELRENCLQAFETFVFRCTNEMSPYMTDVGNICKELLCYDPNYNYGSEGDDEMETDTAPADEEDDQEDYSDDDDFSWKVRRAAAKCIEALVRFTDLHCNRCNNLRIFRLHMYQIHCRTITIYLDHYA
jgi:cullin-associated NEDD8-dissociated protein 1